MKAKVFSGYRKYPKQCEGLELWPIEKVVADYITNGCPGEVKHITQSENPCASNPEFGRETFITVWYEEEEA